MRSFTIVSHQSCPESNTKFIKHIQIENKTHKPKHSIQHTPTLNIVLISTTPRPWSRQPTPSSQITNQLNIFTILDPFDHPHLAFPFGLPAVPYRRGRPNVQRRITPTKHSPNLSSMVQPSSHVTTTAIMQGPHRI